MGTTLTGQRIKDTYLGFIKTSDNLEVDAAGKELTDGNGNDLDIYINTDGQIGFASTPDFTLDAGSNTDAFRVPNGSTAQQPTGQSGIIRYNTTDSKLEYFDTAYKFIASEDYVNTEITNLIDSAPGTLDTLNEIAAALNDDPDFNTTITALINAKQDTITGAATTIVSSDLTVSRALVSNGSGKVGVSTVTDIELEYVSGVTSDIQTQIDSKQATITGAATTIDDTDLTVSKALISNSSGKVAVSSVTDTELGYLSGVTSAIQTQFNNITDNNTTYTVSAVDSGDDAIIRLTGSDSSADDVKLVAGSNITITPVGDDITIASTASGGGATNLIIDTVSGDGSTVAFPLSNTITNENNVQVYIDGVYQSKSNYSTSSNTLTFSTAPFNGASIEFTHMVSLNGTPDIEIDNFSGDGSTTGFTLTSEPVSKNNLQIYIDGVYQAKANYSVVTTSLTFTTAPATGTNNIEVTHLKIS